ncbi:MAG: alpha/beta hydrolase-fold protein [Planctomycetota bacterium]|nr:alpha/beta hydrolase-fold protein [Planctomycetota bacterium]
MTENSSPNAKPDSDSTHAPVQVDPTNTSSSKPRQKSLLKGVLIIVILLGSLVVIYAFQPKARAYALNAIEAMRSGTDEFLNPPPERDLALLSLAASHWQMQDWEKIVDSHSKVVELEPQNYTTWSRLGSARHRLGDYQGAIEAHRNATYSPIFAATAWYNLACEYALTDQIDEAFEALDQSLRLGFGNVNLIQTDPELDVLREDDRFFIPPAPERLTYTTQDGTEIQYWLVLPKDFDPEKSYPGLVGVAGGNQNINGAQGSLSRFWGMQAYRHGWIVIAPAAPRTMSFFVGEGHLQLEELLDSVLEEYNIEDGKFHIAGYSNGGTSAFNIASQFPDKFQSVTVFPGYAIPGPSFDRLENLTGMHVSMYWGEKDLGPSEKFSRETHARLKMLGIESSIKEFPGEPHIPHSLMGDELIKLLDSIRQTNSTSDS